MDQAVVAGPVDLVRGLANTVTVLNAKARGKAITVTIATPPDLPPARGFAGELNQIWSNLIDNALDAAPTGGRVDVSAGVERQRIVVRVVDDEIEVESAPGRTEFRVILQLADRPRGNGPS